MSEKLPNLEDAIRVHFAPLLRQEGFKGAGRTFRRVVDDTVHVVNVQGFYYGGRFAVNLGVQPLGLPYTGGGTVDPKKVTHEKCEFRDRLAEGNSVGEWDHDGTSESMAAAVTNAAGVFQRSGVPFFSQFSGPTSLLLTLQPGADIDALGRYSFGSSIRIAYAMARLRKLQCRLDESAKFAQWALAQGSAPPFEGHAELLTLSTQA
ncbi:DUF4304 domain-containing protein [Acidovorax sp. LjRoot117]|uniref:DUF4304 domain-containing protein n=1 Tax=Acidovorax sp. LjRoot117 TaxID=3342255 RepID=UPI003ECCC5B3